MVIWQTPSPSSVHVVYGCPLMVMSDTRKLLDQEIDWALQRKEKKQLEYPVSSRKSTGCLITDDTKVEAFYAHLG